MSVRKEVARTLLMVTNVALTLDAGKNLLRIHELRLKRVRLTRDQNESSPTSVHVKEE